MSTPTALADGNAMTGPQLDELCARVVAMPVHELAEMPREVVRAWPGDPKAEGDVSHNPRAIRRQKMLASRRRVRIDDIADMGGVGRDAVAKWRGVNIRTGESNTRALLDPIPLSAVEIARLAARERRTGRKPRPSRDWYEGEVWAWLDDTERVDADLYPPDEGLGGRRPPGRTPRQREGK